jgi:ABC-2 type transport system ATP-binding protein
MTVETAPPPAELRRTALPGTLLNVLCDDPMRAVRLLEGAPGVREVALYGTAIHVQLDWEPAGRPEAPECPSAEALAAGLRAWLEARGIAVRAVAPIEPSLEDVFISLIEQGRS